ncbi:ArsR/SmtB family transcription factor [Massilia antarctica]|uniref:ArsR/SmtB family transcription factor n=1 Tax=Massilia antarctica TaxID=2765360 RepID=UPI0006BB7DE6|nr:metalloregulator ArsR/SmtB family transcription factor [Massilia sp. H27-R4]MCY0914376.1 metalloregulator ArsR/SmtB family transcription factor [Massilia sp. H27-R4]CUI03249.1 transcriptional regulator SoxR [Janthinobacterium sp. CG23_2]CUU27035.1 transcriptional regulator SoxR [Janthinobacterium sp. CG23_2]
MDPELDSEQMSEVFEEVSNYFSLLSEPTRLKILHALCHGERTVGAIVGEIGATQANVSRQLNMLYRARILGRRKEGAQVYYRIEDQNTIALCRTVCSQMAEKVKNSRRMGQGAIQGFMGTDA